jgi:3',5'-cyclic AMP phosphodiesterase CpdA
MAPLITIGLVTDIHYANSTVGQRYCGESLVKLKQCLDTFKDRKPDVIMNLGDSIDTSDPVEDELVRLGEIQDAILSTRIESHYLLGNHDVAELTRDVFLKAAGFPDGKSYYSLDCRGVHMVVLDSNFNEDGTPFSAGNFCWYDAWVGAEQIAWLKDDLEAAGSMPVIVFCHANLDDRMRDDGKMNGHIVKDAAAVRDVIEASDHVRAVVQGHCHSGAQTIINGIPYIILRAMVVGSGETAYSLLSLMEDGEVVLEGFGNQESMRFVPQSEKKD